MISVAVDGAFNVKKGDSIKIIEAYFYNEMSIRAPSIENLSTGEEGHFDKPVMTIPLIKLNPPLVGRVEKVERHGRETIITIDTLSNEAFLSYNTKDKHIAGKVKRELEKYGIKSFLAHDELDISSEWRDEIYRHLNSCAIAFPLITDNFNSSPWANQETGYAIAKNKIVVPLIFDQAKMAGLVEGKQGVILNSEDIENGIKKLIGEIKRTHSVLLPE